MRRGVKESGLEARKTPSEHQRFSLSMLILQCELDPVLISFHAGGESILGSLPAPADPQPEAPCSGQEGGVRGQFEDGN